MLNNLFSKGLNLRIGHQDIHFSSPEEFEFSLSGRTDVPSSKMVELARLTPSELKQEARNIKSVEKRFVKLLSKAIEQPGSITEALQHLDPHVFSQDHSWRDIMTALNEKDEDYDDLKKLALVKYMQYLSSRQDLIKYTYSMLRQRSQESAPEPDSNPVDQPGSADFRETVILDSKILQANACQADLFHRMPKGEVVDLKLPSGHRFPLRLSKHENHLCHNGRFEFIDDQGQHYPLQDGKNIIGRDQVCNIILPSAYRDISRMHLIIEVGQGDQLRLTDLSSHGTFLPGQFLP